MATHVVNSLTRLVNGDGDFKKGIEKDLKLDVEDSPLAVVSIIGTQSSGKSTLLNYMFGTKFKEMDAKSGRQRTTKGIWIAKYQLKRGCILVIDTEGSDGTERRGNETFARQTAVFVMAISRVVIINMMCTDIGRELGGGWPLLRTACEVMLRKFKTPHQVTLVFVLRDKTVSPLPALKNQIMDEMDKILKRMPEFLSQANARLSSFFKIKVVATSHYSHAKPNFKAEVKNLRNWIISETTSKRSTSERIPTSSFTTYAEKIWKEIRNKKDLNLPSYMILVAKEQCDRIADKQRDSFGKNKSWLQIEKNVKSGSSIRGFGKDVSDLISTHLSRYDREAKKYDRTTRKKCWKRLIKDLLQIIEPTYLRLVERMRRKTLADFKKVAVDQLKNDGTLKGVEVQAFIDKFDHKVKDAYIKQADWRHESRQRHALQRDIKDFERAIEDINAQLGKLGKQKVDKKNTLMTIAKVVLSIGLSATSVALGNPLGAAGVPAIIIPLVSKLLG